MRQTFAWFPDQGSQHECSPLVTVTKFGDGYELRSSSGINVTPQKWSLTFSVTREIGADILQFVRSRKGQESFYWTNPLSEVGTYVCRTWKATMDRGMMVVACTFEQVFEGGA